MRNKYNCISELRMAKSILIVLLVLIPSITLAQESLKLDIKKGADRPNSEPEQLYLLEVKNQTRSAANFTIETSNTKCENHKTDNQVRLKQIALDKSSKRKFSNYTLQPNTTYEFYVKISRSSNVAKNKWNCTEVKAVNDKGETISNTITITSFVPDDKDQH